MKKVIRHSVFETNSSSTHSLSIKKCNHFTNKPEKDCSFEIRSPLCKVVWLMGLIDNAQEEFNERVYYYLHDELILEIKISILEKIEKDLPAIYQKLNDKYKNDIINNSDLFELHDYIIELGYEDYSFGSDYEYLEDYEELKFLNRCKELSIKAYAELENISIEQATENVIHEAFGLERNEEKKFLNPKTRDKMIKHALKTDKHFKEVYEKHQDKSNEEIVNIFLKERQEQFLNSNQGKVSCCRYFENGILNECRCGYEDCINISNALAEFDMLSTSSDEELIEGAKKFLSDKYKVVGEENYQRCMRIRYGIIY